MSNAASVGIAHPGVQIRSVAHERAGHAVAQRGRGQCVEQVGLPLARPDGAHTREHEPPFPSPRVQDGLIAGRQAGQRWRLDAVRHDAQAIATHARVTQVSGGGLGRHRYDRQAVEHRDVRRRMLGSLRRVPPVHRRDDGGAATQGAGDERRHGGVGVDDVHSPGHERGSIQCVDGAHQVRQRPPERAVHRDHGDVVRGELREPRRVVLVTGRALGGARHRHAVPGALLRAGELRDDTSGAPLEQRRDVQDAPSRHARTRCKGQAIVGHRESRRSRALGCRGTDSDVRPSGRGPRASASRCRRHGSTPSGRAQPAGA